MKIKLLAPPSFWQLSWFERAQIGNGCGAEGWQGAVVPEDRIGFHFYQACKVHDFMYELGKTPSDRQLADKVFHTNMDRIVNAQADNAIESAAGMAMAKVYSEAVEMMGVEAFWAGKPGIFDLEQIQEGEVDLI